MSIFVFDPTAQDPLSKVRGIGRYIQGLKENLPEGTTFTSDLRTVPFDSVFLNPFINFTQPPGITKRYARKQVGIIHDVTPLQFPEHFPTGLRGKHNILRNRFALKTYDMFITDTHASKKNIVEILKIDAKKIERIHPVVSKVFFSPPLKKTDIVLPSSPYFVYAGDVTWNKNLVNLAKAIKLADAVCLFVGKTFTEQLPQIHDDPWKKDFYEFVKLAKNDRRFIFTGYIPDQDLVYVYKNAVANILVSYEEGFGFSYTEAATQKTPSILSDISVFHEVAGDTALFANPHQPEEIAKAMQKIRSDAPLRKSLGQKAFLHLKSLSAQLAHLKDLLA